jgi:hypothetical protein
MQSHESSMLGECREEGKWCYILSICIQNYYVQVP